MFCCCRRSGGRIGGLNRQIFLLMLGLDNAGKTCAARSLVGDKNMTALAPTVGFSKVETRYKGFAVTIYDLGGSKSFRGIWSKYFHEVHGFIFVVDASDHSRMQECRETLRMILRHDKVRGKPLLILCNKSDMEESQDEIQVVDELNVERLVNDARCPTRVEKSVAHRSQGLKVGYKWLVRSVIANMVDLGPRVEADTQFEKKLEAQRRLELRKKIEARKKEEEEEEDDNQEAVRNGGFVPLAELRNKWVAEEIYNSPGHNTSGKKYPVENVPKPLGMIRSGNGKVHAGPAHNSPNVEKSPEATSRISRIPPAATYNPQESKSVRMDDDKNRIFLSPESSYTDDEECGANRVADDPPKADVSVDSDGPTIKPTFNGFITEASSPKNDNSVLNCLPPIQSVAGHNNSVSVISGNKTKWDGSATALDLEPISRPKKKGNLLRKLNRSSVGTSYNSRSGSIESSKPSSSKSSSAESVRDAQVIRAYTGQ